jgi:hypothetical protein
MRTGLWQIVAIVSLTVFAASHAHAQDPANEVVGVSGINAPYYPNIVSYSATELGANVQLWYNADVRATLYQNTEEVNANEQLTYGTATVSLSVPMSPGATYEIVSDHYVVIDENNCSTEDAPYQQCQVGGLDFTSTSASGNGSYTTFDPTITGTEDPIDVLTLYLYLGTTSWTVSLVPEITFNGINVANNRPNPACPTDVACVVVGQQINLQTVFGPGVSPDSQSWDLPPGLPGVIVGGYYVNLSQNPPQLAGPISLPGTGSCQTFLDGCLIFYWVEAGQTGTVNRSFRYHYSISSVPQPDITLNFTVVAPTNVSVSAPTGLVNATSNFKLDLNVPVIVFGGNESGNLGISFSASLSPPQAVLGASELIWVQLDTGKNFKTLTSAGTVYCRTAAFVPQASPPGDPSPALDTSFPYLAGPPPAATNDNPFFELKPTITGSPQYETQENNSLVMYLMWDPALPQNCSPWNVVQKTSQTVQSNCASIPVPLGTISWKWGCDAINTLTPQPAPNSTTWMTGCISPPQQGQATFVPGTSFPSWTHTVGANAPIACKSTPFN